MSQCVRLTGLTSAEFYSHKIEISDYDKQGIEAAEKLATEVSEFHPAHVEFEIENYEGKYYYNHGVSVFLKHPSLKIRISRTRQGSKTYFSIYHTINLKNISHYEQTRLLSEAGLTEPNSIGVLTTKKIADWISYYEKRNEILTKAEAEKGNEIEKFIKSLDGLEVKWFNNKKSGEVVRNGILFKFEISEGYVSQRIEVHYRVNNNLQDFLRLSDNKYIPSK